MLDISLKAHLSLVIFSFLGGALLGLSFESVRFLKALLLSKSLPIRCVHAVMTFLFDLLFTLLAGALGVLLIWSYAEVFRGLTFLCMGAGFGVYRLLCGRLFLKLHVMTAKRTRKCLKKLAQWLSIPFHGILSLIISCYHLTIGRFLGKIKGKIKEARKKREARQQVPEALPEPCGKEAFVYVDRNAGYRKEGRISFGSAPTRKE